MTTSSTSVAMTTSPASSANPDLVARVAAEPLDAARAHRRDRPRPRDDPPRRGHEDLRRRRRARGRGERTARPRRELRRRTRDEVAAASATSISRGTSWVRCSRTRSRASRSCASVLATVSRAKELERIARGDARPGALRAGRLHRGRDAQRRAARARCPALVRARATLELDVRGLMTVAAPDPALGARRPSRIWRRCATIWASSSARWA